MFMNFPLGLAFGIKMAEQSGVADVGARRRAGIALGAAGFTPVGLVLAKTMIDREVAAEAPGANGAAGVADPVSRVVAEAVGDVVPLLRAEVDRALDPAMIAEALALALAGRLATERVEDAKAVAGELAAVLVPAVHDAIVAASAKQAGTAKAAPSSSASSTGKD